MNAQCSKNLRIALLECALDRYQHVPQEHEISYTFSKRFEKAGRLLIKKTKPHQHQHSANFGSRSLRVAIAVAILLALLSLTAMAVPAIREALIAFFLSEREDSYGITFDPEQAATAPQGVQTYRTPQYIPDGYELILDDKSMAAVVVAWMNNQGQLITYNQVSLPLDATRDNWIGFNSEGAERLTINLCGYQVEILQYVNDYIAIWTDNEYLYYMDMENTVSFDALEQIISSIIPISE